MTQTGSAAFANGMAPPTRKRATAAVSNSAIGRIAPLAIMLASIFVVAPEARFEVGGLAFPPYRIFSIVLFAVVIPRIVRGAIRFCLPDFLVIGGALWMLVSFVVYYGFSDGIVRSVAIAIDAAFPYFIARACITEPNDIRRLLIVLAPFMAIAGIVMMLESVTHTIIWRNLFISVFGPLPSFAEGREAGVLNLASEIRMGLQRAFGPFSHPILGGIVLSSALPLFVLSKLRGWPIYVGTAASLMSFFALSSATIMGLLLGVGCVIGHFALKYVKGIGWPLVSTAIIVVGLIAHFASKGGIINVVSRLTLVPHTAYYRQLIWEYGWQSMIEHPWIGIGYTQYSRPAWMTASIDAHFLAIGVRNGFISATLLLLAFIYVIIWLGSRIKYAKVLDRDFLVGLNVMLIVLLIASMTVTFFSEAQSWFMAILAIGTSMSLFLSPSGQMATSNSDRGGSIGSGRRTRQT